MYTGDTSETHPTCSGIFNNIDLRLPRLYCVGFPLEHRALALFGIIAVHKGAASDPAKEVINADWAPV